MKSVIRFLWGLLRVFHTVAASILLVLIFVVLANVFAGKAPPTVPEGAALVVAPSGVLVEKTRPPEFSEMFAQEVGPEEVLLRDLLEAIRRAKTDDRIGVLALELDELMGGGAAAAHALAKGIEDFKTSGKPVIALGDSYSQLQYLIASHADEVWMNPFGSVVLTGYGVYSPYFAEALGKLDAQVHVFRVGAYKSAVEPFVRNSMSEEAKEANQAFLGVLWARYTEEVARQRGLAEGALTDAIANIVPRLQEAGGDLAQLALAEGLVDELKTRGQMLEAMVERVGGNDNGRGYNGIETDTYLQATDKEVDGKMPVVAVVTVRGAIVPGEAPADQAGAETISELIGRARRDDKVKAIVLRVDSPGGSAFASEVIRQELVEAQNAGKPVVASFSSVAASGGYWISATADEIWAMPETITGSIGIFGLFVTLQDTLAGLGISVDGVGTTQLTNALNPLTPLKEPVAQLVQLSIEEGYERFISLVAQGRGMSEEAVEEIAQGRVWAGATAKELGLVDQLGGLDGAIAAAAARVELEEGEYRVVHVEQPLTPFQRLLAMMRSDGTASLLLPAPIEPTPLQRLARKVGDSVEALGWLQDPQGSFALCLSCDAR